MQDIIDKIDKQFADKGYTCALIYREAWQTLKAAVLAQQTTNSAMDAICALDKQICKYSSDNVTVISCRYTGECPHKQHQ